MKSRIFLLAAMRLIPATYAAAQPDSAAYYAPGTLRYEDFIYVPSIRTVRLEKEGFRLSDPVILYGTDEKLVLTFDDLAQEVSDYSYEFIHCTSEWQPTAMPVSYYVKGFTQERIRDYRYSFNTQQPYTHFTLSFPNDDLQPELPGNYVIRVFETDRPDQSILTRRWIFFENKVRIEGVVRRATVIADRYSRQEVDFRIDYQGLPVQNPFSEFNVVLMQNGRWDNAIRDLKPLYIKGTELDYDYEEGNTFNGTNEFRSLDTRSYRQANMYMKGFLEDSTGIHAYVKDDFSRAAYRYSIEEDLNGGYLPAVYEGRDPEVEADYIHVHFKLLMDEPAADGTLYVFGGLTDWRIIPEARLRYDYEKQAYEASLYLKQGFYNYEYVMLRDGQDTPDDTFVEGNHFETENDYSVLIYYRPPGARYEQPCGWREFSSKNIY